RSIGVYEQRWAAPAGPLCVYLHGVRDPGNVGTILRCAQAFGASSVALGPGCADPYGPKAVRASMGAIFAVPVARVDEPQVLPGERIAAVAARGGAGGRGGRSAPPGGGGGRSRRYSPASGSRSWRARASRCERSALPA